MEKFLIDMADIFEVDSVSVNDRLEEFDSFDSLTILSIIIYLDQVYSVKKSASEINACATIKDVYRFVSNAR